MARHPGTADGGHARAGLAAPRPGLVALSAIVALLAADVAAAPAELPPWRPAGSEAPVASPAPPPASAPSPTAAATPASPAPPPATAPTSPTPAPASPATPPAATTSPTPAPASPPAAPVSPSPGPGPRTGPASTPPAALSDELPPPPRDPNDAPFMRPPNNQFQGLPPRTSPDIRRRWSSRRRFAFTVAPTYAQFRLPFQGGRPGRLHGAGLNLELDVQIWRWIWLRGHGTYSGHPVDEVRAQNSAMEIVQTAPRGTIHATGFGAGPVFALDLGRWLPLIEVGLGGLRITTPHSGEKGQRGEACGDNRACDIGLKCSAANLCEQTIIPDLYFGAAVDLLVRRNFSIGAQFRYYSKLAKGEITKFPVYLLGTIRIAVRF